MKASALLLSTATHWFAQARMPRCLSMAGFEVSILAPRGSLGEKSSFVKYIGHLPENANVDQWILAFAATVRATSPTLLLPCDDVAFRLLAMLVLAPPSTLRAALQLELSALIAASLGAPALYRTSVDKTLLSSAAEALGVRVPPYIVTDQLREAEALAATHGYPIVVKRGYSTAGDGVEICTNPEEVTKAFVTLRRPDGTGLADSDDGRLLVQAHVTGKIQYYAGVAWKGALICGTAVEKIAGEPKGPSTVSRYFRSDALRDASARLAQGFEMSGIFAPEFAIDERSGEPYLLELNRRMTHGTHRGAAMNVDPALALIAAMSGTRAATRADLEGGEEHVCVHFPPEWLRDPKSAWLTDYPVDVPWDEPELVEAMVALRKVL